MTYIEICGGQRLSGEIAVQGSKNAVLPMIAGAVLHTGEIRIRNCPDIADVKSMMEIITSAGGRAFFEQDTLVLNTTNLQPFEIDPQVAVKTRASVLFLGALLGRFQETKLSYPGGCLIGKRPIDLHCMVMEQLGAELLSLPDAIYAKGNLHGGEITLPFPSVGATENALLAAVLAKGKTKITGAAKEPEILSLCAFLNKAGANIIMPVEGTFFIEGVEKLHDVEYILPADRIVTGTYLAAAAATHGKITVTGIEIEQLAGFLPVLAKTGVQISSGENFVTITGPKRLFAVKEICTEPFPGFPTDMQSQMLAILTCAQGESRIVEALFEARFLIVEQLRKMGACITLQEQCATVYGVEKLHGVTVQAKDLRGGAALVLAGLAAEGKTRVEGYSYIVRGYENICRDLSALGAQIRLIEERE